MENKIIVLAYVGTGKAEMAKRYERIWNPSSDDYRYVWDKEMPSEKRKGDPSRTENPEFPNNFINAIFEKLADNIILLSLTENLFHLYDSSQFRDKMKEARIILACPGRNAFNDYIKRYRVRGNSERFIENRQKEFPCIMDKFENAEGYEKVVVDEYLDDALIKHGVKLFEKNREA
ncbi:MAG: hypothetical protein FWE31_00865 [Firmicutes bacterium]|nr:hypothetical protein [Bacillota bacterium]